MSKGTLGVMGCSLKGGLKAALVAGGLLFSALTFAQTSGSQSSVATPADWLTRMVAAPSVTAYEGLFVYENASGISAVRIFHKPEDNIQKERLIYQDGPYREIVREGDKIAFIRPDGDISRFRTEGVSGLVERLSNYQDDLRQSYRLLFGGNDRVAGRNALRIEVQPRDSHRYGFALWLDRDTGLMLRSELIGEKGAILERLQYVDLSTPQELPAQLLEPSRPVNWQPAPKKQPVPEASALKALSWEMGWIPSGFELAGISQADSPVSRQKVDSLLFSDGLSAFSVFVEKDQSKVLGPASEQIGATAAISRLFRQGDDYFNVTVIGEIPVGVAERVAVSVKPRNSSSQPSADQNDKPSP
ncbi:MucB/RseB C-terminal domain-containing protein [Parendozoicomonas haliclonae]|uniref:Sigma factor AlgU regulatory protein MucB n=1 Tax=Parendozoicomonas haliclonae TaxID=1960125 RepID=A0A1X7AQT0_9GAMM|nr:MucB/RseB C-terminal domain-containing protein [Parendozoicomonas haliclonae]SMA50449.1 Sigma factor AlgU regulatory protein MucB precursor [Parendozoicomonas haliclonae]